MTSAARRDGVRQLQQRFAVSERCACRLVGISRSTVRYQPRPRDDTALLDRMKTLAVERPRFGYRRLHALLRREGYLVNHKRVYRLYRQSDLAVRRRKRKSTARIRGAPAMIGSVPNERWCLDFTSDTLVSGRPFRILAVLDTCTREALSIEVNTSLPGAAVTHVLDQVIAIRQAPQSVVLDNGPELTSRHVDQWAAKQGVQLDFIEPGKPIQNAGYPRSG